MYHCHFINIYIFNISHRNKFYYIFYVSGPKHISTPIYLYNDHESRHIVLRQLIRLGEKFYSAKIDQNHSNIDNLGNRRDQNANSLATSFLSFNMYKFNYEIGKKEYIINGKSERRIRNIRDHHVIGQKEDLDCNEVNLWLN